MSKYFLEVPYIFLDNFVTQICDEILTHNRLDSIV